MKKIFRILRVAKDLAGVAVTLGLDFLDAVRSKKHDPTTRGYDSL